MGYHIKKKNGVAYITFDVFDTLGWLAHGFSTRVGGVSVGCCASMNLSFSTDDSKENITENYIRMMRAVNIPERDIPHSAVFSKQIHSDNICVVEASDAGNGFDRENKWAAEDSGGADGLMTDSNSVTLVTYYADCVPVFLADPRHRAICLVHAGWRGTALGIATKAVQCMKREYGSKPKELLAAIGPSIGKCHFETHSEVAEAFGGTDGEYGEYIEVASAAGKFCIDLKGINKSQLEKNGLCAQNIDIADICTACNTDMFFSHRIMGPARGSMAAFMKIL